MFSTSLLGALTDQEGTLRVQVSIWKKKGLIRSLRKGLYILSPEERHWEPSLFYLANQIFSPSYVSLESALAYHGLIPEFVATTTSVTVRKTCRFENDFGVFTYQRVIPNGFDGFESIRESEKVSALVATPEKAVVDFLYLRVNLAQFKKPDRRIFSESYRFQNCEGLNRSKLRAYAKRFGSKRILLAVESFIEEVLG